MGLVIHHENARGSALAGSKARFRLRAGTSRERHCLRSCQVQCQDPVLQDLRPSAIRPCMQMLLEQLFAGRYAETRYSDLNKSAPIQPMLCSSLHGIHQNPIARLANDQLKLETIAQAVPRILWIPSTFQKALERGKCRSNKGKKQRTAGLRFMGSLPAHQAKGPSSLP